jgi:DNA-binding LacI/PurR family transcriptional regulator
MTRKVTIEDIARRSNASAATVSLVLRQKPGISSETRQRVLDAAAALGYHRTPSPATAVTTLNIGLILRVRTNPPGQEQIPVNPFYSWVLTGIDAAAQQQRLNLLYASLRVDEDNHPLDMPEHLLGQSLDGLLLVGAFTEEVIAQIGARRETPIVLVDAPARPHRHDAIATDNETGAYGATRALLARGHRQIAFVDSRFVTDVNFRQRRDGYLRAMQEQALPTYFAGDDEPLATALPKLLTTEPRITALFGCNDFFAVEAANVARAQGYRIPHDLSIMGFDDIESGRQMSPPLTTMAVDKVSMGRLAVQALSYRMAWPDAAPILTTLQPRLLERQSVRQRKG